MWKIHSISFCGPNVKLMWGWRDDWLVWDSYPWSYSFVTLYPTNMCAHFFQTQEARRNRGCSCSTIKTACFFVSYRSFLSQLCSNLRVPKKKKHIRLLIVDGEQEGRGLEFIFSRIGPHTLYVRYCLCAFPPIAQGGFARRGVKRQQPNSPTVFDVCVLWSHVNALSVKSFCCPLIRTSERLVDSTETLVWGGGRVVFLRVEGV